MEKFDVGQVVPKRGGGFLLKKRVGGGVNFPICLKFSRGIRKNFEEIYLHRLQKMPPRVLLGNYKIYPPNFPIQIQFPHYQKENSAVDAFPC